MRKQYKSSKIKIKKKKLIGVPLKGYVAIFRFHPRNEKQYCGNIQ